MEVKLIRSTLAPEQVCTQAMAGCQSTKAAFEISTDGVFEERLMKMAVSSGHESVLEHAVFTFSVKGISRACSHQLVRHRIASYSQQSQRHVKPTKIEDWYVTPPSLTKFEGELLEHFAGTFDDFMHIVALIYDNLIKAGIPEEDARFVLPNACKTNIVITMNARELRHFFKLRRAKEAQWEIREMADRMFELVQPLAPNIFRTEENK